MSVMATSRARPSLRTVAARNTIVEANLRLAFKVAALLRRNHYIRALLTAAEAISAANLGLIRAAELWDEKRGIKFSTYAFRWIAQFVREEARRATVIHVPSYVQDAVARAKRAGRPTDRPAQSGDNHADEGMLALGTTFLRTGWAHADPVAPQPAEPFDPTELYAAFAKLPQADQHLLHARFWDGQTLAEIGDSLQYTKERIRQKIVIALENLRAFLAWA
jgi:RNA polymerase sigma factor (sigma-70 family)